MKLKSLLALLIVGVLVQSVQAQDEQTTRMKTLLAAPSRPADSKARDAERKPIETVQFMGIKTG